MTMTNSSTCPLRYVTRGSQLLLAVLYVLLPKGLFCQRTGVCVSLYLSVPFVSMHVASYMNVSSLLLPTSEYATHKVVTRLRRRQHFKQPPHQPITRCQRVNNYDGIG